MPSYVPRPTPAQVGRQGKLHYSVREVLELLMFELNKVSAPSIDVETFNHFHRTARDNYYKRRYQLYDTGQLTTDQMRDMSQTFVFTATSTPPLDVAQETYPYPALYYHTLGVTVFYRITTAFKTFKKNSLYNKAAERVAGDRLTMLRDDFYNRPQLKKPYFFERPSYVEIHTGLHSGAVLEQVELVYLLLAEEVFLLESDLDDLSVDPSQVLREHGIVTLEVLKELTTLVLENQVNERVQSHAAVSAAESNQLPAPAGAAPARSR